MGRENADDGGRSFKVVKSKKQDIFLFPGWGMNDESIRQTVTDILKDLVHENSVSGSESIVAQKVQRWMTQLKFDEIFVDANGSVVGVMRGAQEGPTILFDAHMDVVPVNHPESWTHNPFGGEESDGKIWGRGTTDIKGGLAAILTGIGSVNKQNIRGTRVVTASIGEEVMEGSGLRDALTKIHPDLVVVSEPSQCQLGIGQKGRTSFWLEFEGKPAHSSSPDLGVNAIYRAMDAAQRIRNMAMPEDAMLGKGVQVLVETISRPYPGECTVPYGCHLRYDRRLVSGETKESVLESIRKEVGDEKGWNQDFLAAELKTYTGTTLHSTDFYPGWNLQADSAWVKTAFAALKNADAGGKLISVPYCTNASYTAGELGIPTVIYGPSTIALAHVVDEYVEISELVRAAKGYAALACADWR